VGRPEADRTVTQAVGGHQHARHRRSVPRCPCWCSISTAQAKTWIKTRNTFLSKPRMNCAGCTAKVWVKFLIDSDAHRREPLDGAKTGLLQTTPCPPSSCAPHSGRSGRSPDSLWILSSIHLTSSHPACAGSGSPRTRRRRHGSRSG
jgi:hypothetical protein